VLEQRQRSGNALVEGIPLRLGRPRPWARSCSLQFSSFQTEEPGK
jgi:hypothetical protein